jgi:hypothetical protein
MSALCECVAMRLESICNAAQESRALLACGLRAAAEGVLREVRCLIEFARGRGAVDGLEGSGGLWGKCLKAGASARTALRTDEGESSEFHSNFRLSSIEPG